MSNLKVISEPWKDFGGEDTEALYLDVDRQYTISEFIAFNWNDSWGYCEVDESDAIEGVLSERKGIVLYGIYYYG